MKKTIVLVGRLDSKGQEYACVKDRIARAGFGVIIVDVGTRGTPQFAPDISREEVAKAAGVNTQDVVDRTDENREIQIMMRGAAAVVKGLFDSGRLDGIVALGGSRGTAIGTAAMRALPFGIPKVMVSTIASGDMRPYVGTKDIAIIHSVTDILGLNRMTRRLLANAAGAIMGAVDADPGREVSGKPLIAVSSMGGVNRAVFSSQTLMEGLGFEVVAFHAVGTGGRALEETVEQGLIDGVLDLVTHELTDHILGGYYDAGPTRLETAGAKGIPQVIAPGCLDFIAFSPPDRIPESMKGRKVFFHTPEVAIVRTTEGEMVSIGEAMAAKLNKALGPTAVVIPMKGFSPGNREGRALFDPEADRAFVGVLKRNLKPSVRLVELDAHVNDEVFAERAVELLCQLMGRGTYSKTPAFR
ncbi:MAG: hypothetical protein A2147_03640 [Chloroflexi bacterium RBG_16_57_8]|nr:MAG: hypothetical protein A2147_03640 [Chloroflexi bacterium RBG_16_57_8]